MTKSEMVYHHPVPTTSRCMDNVDLGPSNVTLTCDDLLISDHLYIVLLASDELTILGLRDI